MKLTANWSSDRGDALPVYDIGPDSQATIAVHVQDAPAESVLIIGELRAGLLRTKPLLTTTLFSASGVTGTRSGQVQLTAAELGIRRWSVRSRVVVLRARAGDRESPPCTLRVVPRFQVWLCGVSLLLVVPYAGAAAWLALHLSDELISVAVKLAGGGILGSLLVAFRFGNALKLAASGLLHRLRPVLLLHASVVALGYLLVTRHLARVSNTTAKDVEIVHGTTALTLGKRGWAFVLRNHDVLSADTLNEMLAKPDYAVLCARGVTGVRDAFRCPPTSDLRERGDWLSRHISEDVGFDCRDRFALLPAAAMLDPCAETRGDACKIVLRDDECKPTMDERTKDETRRLRASWLLRRVRDAAHCAGSSPPSDGSFVKAVLPWVEAPGDGRPEDAYADLCIRGLGDREITWHRREDARSPGYTEIVWGARDPAKPVRVVVPEAARGARLTLDVRRGPGATIGSLLCDPGPARCLSVGALESTTPIVELTLSGETFKLSSYRPQGGTGATVSEPAWGCVAPPSGCEAPASVTGATWDARVRVAAAPGDARLSFTPEIAPRAVTVDIDDTGVAACEPAAGGGYRLWRVDVSPPVRAVVKLGGAVWSPDTRGPAGIAWLCAGAAAPDAERRVEIGGRAGRYDRARERLEIVPSAPCCRPSDKHLGRCCSQDDPCDPILATSACRENFTCHC